MHYNTRECNPNWNGGKTKCKTTGKKRVLCCGHPRSNPDGYVFEHILIAEKAVGHYLSAPIEIHHVDGNPSNNDPSNLVICNDHAYHRLLHKRTRSYRATGKTNSKYCPDCDTWKPPEEFYKSCSQCKPCRDKRHYQYLSSKKEAHCAASE